MHKINYRWFQSELPAALKSRRDSPHLLHSELVKLMEWKLSRGKFRPRLVDLAASNTNELVKQVTTEGLKLAKENEPSRALAVLCKLRGVGPATASSILVAAAPDKYVFFADEVAHAALGTTSLKYSEAEYLKLNDVIIEAANQINKEQAMNESEVKVSFIPPKLQIFQAFKFVKLSADFKYKP
ncbi:hypothetical protein HAZT_HAZT009930 [Hyalella azteca]|uniref:Uncharacterized protein n=1 Tax=Hyalella azteca TaxID=294128 RepID=A0A6A0GYE7_HYAAZ|nr:hypothetical protein HAZT_HAZT009930 [Hyalella azteca]